MKFSAHLVAGLLFLLTNALGQELTNFELTNVVNEETVSLDQYSASAGLVIIFTSNNCPYDDYYRNRVRQLAARYSDRIPVLLVNSHTGPAESVAEMEAMTKMFKIGIPYLADKDQVLSARLAVKKSPEAFLLKKDNSTFRVVYRGAIDDNAQVEEDVRHPYLQQAIENLLAGRKVEMPEARPVGCNLRKKS